jgi:cytochrome c oxidase subunit 4
MNQVAEHAPVAEHPHTAEHAPSAEDAHAEGQQHPIRIYLVIWGLLFVFSVFSYLVDYFDLQGPLRWTLIITFMLIKAGFIVAVFMHMAWERLVILIGLMAIEGDYTFVTRLAAFVSQASR